ncbi:MAG: hypothetical protein ACTHLN_11910, partial [Tepidisphaeraceae bacterium]
MHHLLESLEHRSLMAASPVDTTFKYDPTALTAAAGQHISVTAVVAGQGGQYLMLGKTAKGAAVVARLNENGRLDDTFGNGGVADPAINIGTGVLHVTSDSLGYTYVYDNTSVTRLRGNGTRDIGYGRRSKVDFSFAGSAGPLDAETDNAGGIDVVVRGESTASLVHINSAGTTGVLWSSAFAGNTDRNAGNYDVITFGYVAHVVHGNFVVVTSRQVYGNNPDPDALAPAEVGGDADVFYLSPKGNVLYTRHFDTGVAVSRAETNFDADPVTLYYGQRKLYIRSGSKMSRTTLPFSQTPNLPGGGLLSLSTQAAIHSGSGGTYGVYSTTADLYNVAGAPDRSLNGSGTYSLADRIDERAAVVDVFAGRQSDVLVGSYVPQLNAKGQETGVDDLNLLRLWTTDDVSATLVSAKVSKQRAIVTVRYRAKGGVNDTTIGNGDLAVAGLSS